MKLISHQPVTHTFHLNAIVLTLNLGPNLRPFIRFAHLASDLVHPLFLNLFLPNGIDTDLADSRLEQSSRSSLPISHMIRAQSLRLALIMSSCVSALDLRSGSRFGNDFVPTSPSGGFRSARPSAGGPEAAL